MVRRLTPNGRAVSAWVPAISSASASGPMEPPASPPQPPALLMELTATAADEAAVMRLVRRVMAGLPPVRSFAAIVDDGRCAAGIESTIVHRGRGLRPGPITAEQLWPGRTLPLPVSNGAVIAPGQLASHYAPTKPLRLNATIAAPDEWLIGFGTVAGDETLSAAGDTVEAAANLFDALHRADAGARPRIAVAPIPPDGLGEAIADRLTRAARR